ncbi:DUF2235 domain-containing protein [Paraburkholderia sp. J63]|uniref:T6SS phospholipase effector Tle1-like catalytic domain-containing protein n=1 Tax=Paraburkholderia sp. J63 TaxID=2805434 RepID=UPI002ABD956C|nr:DUF2235 domain-containing protein [Paraburkholderia sp. J63]
MYFDGTNNNKEVDQPLNGHSNVARLFNARIDDPASGFFSYYISGVGTPCKEVGDNDGGKVLFGSVRAGGAAGYMGADRINWGITRVFEAVHAYATGGALLFPGATVKTIVNNMSSSVGALSFETTYRRMVLNTWEKKLTAAVQGSQRKVTQINVAVFGFSRGAAEARAFVNWFSELVRQDDGGYELAGLPIRIYFVGLFDTVASVGIPNVMPGINGHLAWADGSMEIPATVEQCVHYVALHEQRASFPLETAKSVKQKLYPGMHSDVGGGYLPTEQGKLAQCSQIPLNDMHFEAIRAGVPLLLIDEIRQRSDLKKEFDIPKALATAYNEYWARCGIQAGGDALDLIRQHTRQYLQWRGGMLVAGKDLTTRRFFRDAERKDKDDLSNAEIDLMAQIKKLRLQLSAENVASSHVGTYSLAGLYGGVPPTKSIDPVTHSLLAELDRHENLPDEAKAFFDDYVHDSRAGFTLPVVGLEPSAITAGYLRYRNIYENERASLKTASVPQDASYDASGSSSTPQMALT